MKNRSFRLMALLMAALMLLTACTPAITPEDSTTASDTTESTQPEETTERTTEESTAAEDTTAEDTTAEETTETETEEETTSAETYVDLSHDVPELVTDDRKTVTVRSQGNLSTKDVVLEFDGKSGLFRISAPLINAHDPSTCESCGFLPDGGGYLLDDHGSGIIGFRIDMVNGLGADAIQGIDAVFTTSVDAPNSQLRILTANETNHGAILNECPSMAGAVGQDVSLDLTLANPFNIADEDGNVTSFQIYFRNKNNATCTLKKIIIHMSAESLLEVDELEGNFYGRGDVITAIADIVADRFTAAGMGADITVEAKSFLSCESDANGFIRYKVTATFDDGTSIYQNNSLDFPHLSGSWLDNSEGGFGSSHDNLGQWQDTFDPSGMVLLTANPISANEKMISAEYAIIPESGDPRDPSLVWHEPHILEVSNRMIDALFVNAWLDYAEELQEGQRYRLLVRGVTLCSNYILHLDIPFTYSPLDTTVTDRINQALDVVSKADFICSSDTADKSAYITEQLTSLVNDSAIEIKLSVIGEGVNTITVQASVLYKDAITAERMPVYTLNGQSLSAVYAFEGTALTTDTLRFHYNTYEGSIQLLTPYDGDRNVILASPDIYALFNSTVAEIESGKYPFKFGENCLPVPAELTWADSNATEKTYTVLVSKQLDMSNPIVLATTECRISVYNLEVGRTYYWQVTDGEEFSQIFTFTTVLTPRFFSVDGVSNVRDLGGYYTVDGKRVKQNMVFRSAHFDDASAEGINFMVNVLGIKTELDFRGPSKAVFDPNRVRRVVIPIYWYSNIFREEHFECVRQTISAFAYPENYPINFHCALGRDRTGTTSFLILGLLGVDQETLLKEHYSSFFSTIGACDKEEFLLHILYIGDLAKGFARFAPKGATLQEQIEGYLLHIGVTAEEIASIRSILLED